MTEFAGVDHASLSVTEKPGRVLFPIDRTDTPLRGRPMNGPLAPHDPEPIGILNEVLTPVVLEPSNAVDR